MWEILLNSVFNGWLKLFIVVPARKWVVLLTNYKWVVVNSIRVQKWVVHSYKTQMGYKFSATHLWSYKVKCPLKNKLTCMQGFVNLL